MYLELNALHLSDLFGDNWSFFPPADGTQKGQRRLREIGRRESNPGFLLKWSLIMGGVATEAGGHRTPRPSYRMQFAPGYTHRVHYVELDSVMDKLVGDRQTPCMSRWMENKSSLEASVIIEKLERKCLQTHGHRLSNFQAVAGQRLPPAQSGRYAKSQKRKVFNSGFDVVLLAPSLSAAVLKTDFAIRVNFNFAIEEKVNSIPAGKPALYTIRLQLGFLNHQPSLTLFIDTAQKFTFVGTSFWGFFFNEGFMHLRCAFSPKLALLGFKFRVDFATSDANQGYLRRH
ncbi:hypothetical protein C8R43DRAFT_951941 [Mycena crocata]|nr:hypothetical protein C8R43DRAFT_951941 [Mycena crocata]